jgi:hypothetical protein
MIFSRVSMALALALPLAACAPDAWRPDSPYEAFLNQVQNKCWNLDLGGQEINSLLSGGGASSSGDYFIDLTSRMFNGQISVANYVDTLSTFYNTKPDSPGIRCILQQMPQVAPPPPTTVPPVITR